MTVKLYRRDGRFVGVFAIPDESEPSVILLNLDTLRFEVFIAPPPELLRRLMESEPLADAVYMEGTWASVSSSAVLVQ